MTLRPATLATLAALTSIALLSGCGLFGPGEHRPAAVMTSLTVSSPAFRAGRGLPARYTCHGDGLNPPLHWSGLPAATKSIAIVVDDPDAPHGPYVHWVVFNIEPRDTELAEDAVPPGARSAVNSSGSTKYAAPCPPAGEPHDYRFTVYALDSRLSLPDGTSLTTALKAIPPSSIAQGRLVGVFGS